PAPVWGGLRAREQFRTSPARVRVWLQRGARAVRRHRTAAGTPRQDSGGRGGQAAAPPRRGHRALRPAGHRRRGGRLARLGRGSRHRRDALAPAVFPMNTRPVVISLLVIGLLLGVVAARRSSDASTEPHASRESVAWSDNFSGPRGRLPDPRKWSLETGYGWGDGELQSFTGRPANVSLDGRGHLAITARRERYTGHDGRTASYTSARLNTQRKFEFAYGNV